jgi:sugar phosphate isomerase/epimerase
MNRPLRMDDWQKYCTLSLVHFMAFPETQSGEGDFVRSLQQVGDMAFFGAVELSSIHQPAARREVKHILQEYGLKTGFGAQPLILSQKLDLNSLDANVRIQAGLKLGEALEQAAEIGADRFVLLSGRDLGEEKRCQAYQFLEEALVELGLFARKLGIRVVLETFDRVVDKCALVGPSQEAIGLAKRVQMQYPEFGLLYDMGHMPLLEEAPGLALPILREALAEVHLGNCVKTPGAAAYGDKHPRFDYPGGVNGTGELVEFLRVLFEIGYLGGDSQAEDLPWVGFEIRPQPGETTTDILDHIQSTWTTAWEQLGQDQPNRLKGDRA